MNADRQLAVVVRAYRALAYVTGLACHLRCRPGDVASVTTNEMGIIFFGIAGALISAALLVPALAWAALAAAALVALEMRLALQPAETPAA